MGLTANQYKAKYPDQVYDGFGELKNSNIAVGVTAIKIPTTPLEDRRAIIITNNDNANTLYVGHDSACTTGNGFPILKDGGSIVLYLIEDTDVYGIASGTETDVRILEFA